ncbi:MAG: DUF3108 domain-containing protein [Candidatus Eisenbacteria bacterium]|nr:DUF3108 domain-containing protein [Candidatus Eisenbacteria bacterium]
MRPTLPGEGSARGAAGGGPGDRAAAARRLWSVACFLAAGAALLASLLGADRGGDDEAAAPPDSVRLAGITAEARATLAGAKRPGPLQVGEDLTFEIHYGVIRAGEAHLAIAGVESFHGARCYRLRSTARSGGLFGKIYDVNDRVESLLDSAGLMSRRLEKRLHEGSYHQEQDVRFDYGARRACYASGDTLPIPGPVQDDLSAFYVARCLELRENTVYYLETHSNKVTYPMQVRVYGRETVRTEAGEFECLKVEPRVDRGGIFKHRGRMMIWMTADARHLPVRLRSKLPLGAITADLSAAQAGGTH